MSRGTPAGRCAVGCVVRVRHAGGPWRVIYHRGEWVGLALERTTRTVTLLVESNQLVFPVVQRLTAGVGAR